MSMSARLNSLPRFPSRSMSLLIASIVIMLAASVILYAWVLRVGTMDGNRFLRVLPDTAEELAYWEQHRRIRQGGRHYKALKFLCDVPGVEQPELLTAIDVDLPDSTAVVGIDVNGEKCAFVVDAMQRVEDHIVNLIFNRVPVSVTYCNLVDCVRVLKDDAELPIQLHVGGLDIDNQLVFLLNGERYGQESTGLPLKDVPFTRTTLGDWKLRHPSTRIYVGELHFWSEIQTETHSKRATTLSTSLVGQGSRSATQIELDSARRGRSPHGPQGFPSSSRRHLGHGCLVCHFQNLDH